MRLVHVLAPVAPWLALGLLACSASIEAPGDEPYAAAGTGGGSGATGGGAPAGSGGAQGATGGTAGHGVTPTTRVARLTHQQYKNTVAELLGITDDPTSAFAPDALNGFDFDTSVDFRVDARLGPNYRAAAEALAERAVSDAAIFGRIVPCAPEESGCADRFVESFGRRAFRRPLTPAESSRFRGLFEQGGSLVASGDAFRDGVRLVVETALQSPKFLYRAELGADAGSDGLIALGGFELAARLSYTLWNSMPDEPLFAAASDGALATAAGLDAETRRLLDDERALAKLASFHAQALEFERFSRITADEETYPNAPADLAVRVRAATDRFVDEILRGDGGLAELLTAPYAYADAELAPLYGKNVSGGLSRLDFEAGERKGLLMQVGFLASNAYAIKTDPIHRGLFVLRRVLCRAIDEPPPGASQTPLPDVDPPPQTTREEVELLTSPPTCAGCHLDINAPGFSFEGFDAVGQSRSRENGVPVETRAEFELDGVLVAFAGAEELVELLAASPEAHRCYAGRLMEFSFGRALSNEDQAARAALGAERLGARALLAAITKTPAFSKRIPNEVEP